MDGRTEALRWLLAAASFREPRPRAPLREFEQRAWRADT